jgi:hypothetical protein
MKQNVPVGPPSVSLMAVVIFITGLMFFVAVFGVAFGYILGRTRTWFEHLEPEHLDRLDAYDRDAEIDWLNDIPVLNDEPDAP